MAIVRVEMDDIENHPHCIHGPTLKFVRLKKGGETAFFACAASRSNKVCPFHLPFGSELSTVAQQLINDRKKLLRDLNNPLKRFGRFLMVEKQDPQDRVYCSTCSDFLLPNEGIHPQDHEKVTNVSNHALYHPTKILKPIQHDEAEAQYWFTEETVGVLITAIKRASPDGCICLGCPTVHEALRDEGISSLLLDMDDRYLSFYGPEEFGWYNLMNNYFLGDADLSLVLLKKFLNKPRITLIVDPPFGARLEPLVYSLQKLKYLHDVTIGFEGIFNVIIALPYFMVEKLRETFGAFTVMDYAVTYRNHKKINAALKSPVRFITNMNQKLFSLKDITGYYFCRICQYWKSNRDRHCTICMKCPPASITGYKHCAYCAQCVKKPSIHCLNCRVCLMPPHKCLSKKDYDEDSDDYDDAAVKKAKTGN